MATPPLPHSKALEAIALRDKYGGWEAAEKATGIPSNTLKSRAARVSQAEAAAIEPLAERDKRRYTDQIEALRQALRDAHREANREEDMRRALFGLAATSIERPKWMTGGGTSKGKVPTIPVLFTSDFQWGEKITGSELDGVNQFDQHVASRRYKRLIDTTISVARDHMGGRHAYPGIIYCRGGDSVSGDIHDELRETNDLQSIPAAKDLTEHEAEGIRKLRAAFGKVHVVSVPGNHGRTTRKPHAKRFVETNYDTLVAWWLESQFKSDDAVTFQTPMSGDALFGIYGWTWLLTHGDRIGSRGGEGYVGPAATVTRGMKKLTEYYATLGTRIDNILVGHFHTRLELEMGFCNGCLPGYSEYAKGARYRPAEPSQWLLFVHREHGITARWPIQLEHRPRVGGTQGVPSAKWAA
jgi:hypothetical protein